MNPVITLPGPAPETLCFSYDAAEKLEAEGLSGAELLKAVDDKDKRPIILAALLNAAASREGRQRTYSPEDATALMRRITEYEACWAMLLAIHAGRTGRRLVLAAPTDEPPAEGDEGKAEAAETPAAA